MESNITLDLLTLDALEASIKQIESFIRGLNLTSSYVDVGTNKPEVAALVTSLLGNMNKVVTINGTVVKSFDGNYEVGRLIMWPSDCKVIHYHV